MPAEWEEHDATWLSWPKDPDTFPPDLMPEVEKTYVKMVEALAPGEEVRILVDDSRAETRVREMLKTKRGVVFEALRTVDVWVRDYAPICIRGKDVALTKWDFNAWGGKYDDLLPDDAAGRAIARASGLQVFEPGMVLEGGSVDVNGKGTLLTTEQCLLNPNRNPGLTKRGIEWRLRSYLGVRHVVWLGRGVAGDDTDGHVDDVARFVDHGTVALAWERDSADPNGKATHENMKRLRDSLDQDGGIFDVVTLPLPVLKDGSGERLPASHLNFYIGNSAVLVPTFGSPSDANAIGTLKPYFPGRTVVGIDCRALVYGFGSIHCVTQQVPALRSATGTTIPSP